MQFFNKKLLTVICLPLLLAAAVLLTQTHLVSAQSFNQQINYQGKLTDNLSSTVADGTYSIVFRLYTGASGGTNIWSETQSVTVTSGLFSVMLGSNNSLTGVDFAQTLYLGVNIEADGEMTPRKVLGAVPAAFEAGNAQTLNDIASSSFLRSDVSDSMDAFLMMTAGAAVTDLSVSGTATTTNLVVGSDLISSLTGAGLSIVGNALTVATSSLDVSLSGLSDTTVTAPTNGEYLAYNGSRWVNSAVSSLGLGDGTFLGLSDTPGSLSANRLLFANSGGTALTDSANLTFDGNQMSLGGTGLRMTGSTANIALGSNYLSGDGDDEGIFVDSDGNVGIGTSTPSSKLTVVGDASVTGSLRDSGNSAGANGMVLQTSGTSTRWVATSTLGIDSSAWTESGSDIFFAGGAVSIGTSTSESILTLGQDLSTGGTAGVSQFHTIAPTGAGSVAFGNELNLVNAPTTDSNALLGSLIRITDDSSYSNVVRGLEVQADLGSNTLGENTALSGFANTFGVRGLTTGLAGASFVPAGVLAETEGINQGNALRAYTGSMLSGDLAYFLQDTSAFTGTGLRMNLGAGAGSFMGSFLDLQTDSSSQFKVSATGTVSMSGILSVAGSGTSTVASNLHVGSSLQVGSPGVVIDGNGVKTSHIAVSGEIRDSSGSAGTNGMVLQTSGTNAQWVATSTLGFGTGNGSVASVGISAPTGFSVSGSPITNSGTLALSFAAGYSLPTDTKQGNWDTAYGWGDHASAGYLNNASINTSAKIRAIVGDETGSGGLVFANSPALVTPNLGTPSAAVLSNATGLPIIGGTTGTLTVARGGTGATTATAARTNLGATTVGANLFTLTNPGAIRFTRINADNSVSTLDSAAFRTAIGAGTGSGSVASVGISAPTGFSVSGSPITNSGTLALSFAAGYSLPTDTKQGNWDTAYGWGDHASAGYSTGAHFSPNTLLTDYSFTDNSSNWDSFYNTPSSRITAGTNLSWSGSTLDVSGLGDGTFTGLSDTQGSLSANRLLFANSGGTAVTDSAGLTFDGTNLNLGGSNGIAIGGTRMFYASTTNQSIALGEGAGASFTSSSQRNIALGYNAGKDSASASKFNTYIGNNAGLESAGEENSIIGTYAGAYNTGYTNNIMGNSAGRFNSGSSNNIFGDRAGYSSAGINNNLIGQNAGYGNTGGYNNILGSAAGYNNTGSNNNLLGRSAGYNNTGSYSEFIGFETGARMSASSTVAIGGLALRGGSGSLVSGNATTTNNTVIGYGAGYNVTTGGDNNLLLGYQAADNLTTGKNNIVLGYDVDVQSATQSNTLNIGNIIFGTGIDGTGTTLSSGNIGIGTSSPSSKLTVAGDAYITGALYDSSNSAGTNGMVLQTTGTGQQWVATSSLGFGTGNGSVTSVGLSAPTGFTVSNSPVTDSGILALAYAGGYEGLKIASSTNWTTAFGWGDHALAGYLSDADIDTSAKLAAILTDESGTGNVVFSDSPTLTGKLTVNGSAVATAFDAGATSINNSGISHISDLAISGKSGVNFYADGSSGFTFGTQAGTTTASVSNTTDFVKAFPAASVHTYSHNVSGDSPVLIVSVAITGTGGGSSVSGVTYDGTAMARVGSEVRDNSNTYLTLWQLTNPSPGTHNIEITTNTSITGKYLVSGASTIVNVDQTNPVRAFSANTAVFTSSISDTVSSVSGDIVYAAVASPGTNSSKSAGSGETKHWHKAGSFVNSGGFSKVATGGNTSMTINTSTTEDLALITVSLRPRVEYESRFVINSTGNVTVGTTTASGRLSLENLGVSGAGVLGIDQYLTSANSVASAVQYGNRTHIDNTNNTAVTTLVGDMVKVADNTTYGNTVRGLEVQANQGSNTQGENTALSGFARTFGVRGYSSGDAGGTFEPAGGYFETGGTTQGNAIRGYSSTITTSNLLALFQKDSAFAGTGLEMSFGNNTGSFSSSTASKFVDLQNAGSSKFIVYNDGRTTIVGTTTIGTGDTSVMAGLQIGYGGLCVDNDGSCNASTTGQISSVSAATGNSDLAEVYFSSQTLLPGELVVTDGFISVKRATAENGAVLGVVSTKPGLLMGADDTSLQAGQRSYPLALAGRVPVRLSDENGVIAQGDPLTLSSIPGVAMKATESSDIVGYALEAFDGTHAYTAGYVNQFGDDIAAPNYAAAEQLINQPKKASCYYGGGTATGEDSEECTVDEVDEVDDSAATQAQAIAQARYDAEQDALNVLRNQPAQSIALTEGSVRVGHVTMFVDRGIHLADSQKDILNELISTSTALVLGAEAGSEETLWQRLKELAQNFVDGVLTVVGIKAEKVQTSELCIDDVCVTADDLRTLLEQDNQSAPENTAPPEPDAEPEPEPENPEDNTGQTGEGETGAADSDETTDPVDTPEDDATGTSTDDGSTGSSTAETGGDVEPDTGTSTDETENDSGADPTTGTSTDESGDNSDAGNDDAEEDPEDGSGAGTGGVDEPAQPPADGAGQESDGAAAGDGGSAGEEGSNDTDTEPDAPDPAT